MQVILISALSKISVLNGGLSMSTPALIILALIWWNVLTRTLRLFPEQSVPWMRVTVSFTEYVGYPPPPPECLDVSNKKELEDLWQQANANLEKAMKFMAKKYNQGLGTYFSSKLATSFHGPFKIIRFLGPVTVLSGEPTNNLVVKKAHLSQI
ncbi:hypothetical protein PR048_003110 [Dryococelus australis]|uniref:Uncharacterized protein n=1 Tax=Dryococelus australis TaxID=614101 RepID=A0ABQ9INL2_9NEOP|nr:hypothetical protein PR048_003110 [Dryococelus australis]